jgi:hypothetical protein
MRLLLNCRGGSQTRPLCSRDFAEKNQLTTDKRRFFNICVGAKRVQCLLQPDESSGHLHEIGAAPFSWNESGVPSNRSNAAPILVSVPPKLLSVGWC